MRAYLIARVSTEDQRDALPAQVHKLLEYANRRGLKYELIEFQESAYKGNREEFKAVIAKIQASTEPVAVVFDKIDRYTRDSSAEEVRILQGLYRAGSIELHFPSDNLVIHKDSPATDIMRLGLGVVLAQYYSDAISDNVKRRLDQKLRDGEWIGKAPIGYKNVDLPNGKKWVEVDEAEATVVRAIYKWYATGISSLNTIRSKVASEYDYDIGTSQIDLILHNPFYMGLMRVKGQLYPHKYETIITERLFDRVNAVRDNYKIEPTIYAGLPYVYRGLVKCADCGSRVTFEKKKGKYVYGHCTQWKVKHGAKYVPEEEFTKQLKEVFESIEIPDHAYEQVSNALNQSREQQQQSREDKVIRLDSEIAKYQKRIEKVYEDFLDELIPKDLYERKFEEYQKSLKVLQGKRKNIELNEDSNLTTVKYLLSLANKAPKLFEKANIEQKRSLIKLVLSNLELKDDLLRWEYNNPFKTMALCAENGNWLTTIEEVITAIKIDLAY